MVATDGKDGPELVGDEPRWLTEQEQATWLEVSTLVFQLPGLLEAQLQRDADVGLFEYLVMSWLSMVPDRQARMGQLAQLAQGSVSRLSNVVKRLEQQGFVRREPDPTNGRYTLALLTDSGWAKVVKAAPGHVETVRRYVLDPLTPEQVGALHDISQPIAARLRRAARGESSEAPCEDDGDSLA